MKESVFQHSVIEEIKKEFPTAIVMKTDSSYIQGIPDLLILYNGKWAALECKNWRRADRQPNQEYYVNLLDSMSFARFIFPENKKEVLCELFAALRNKR